MDKRLDGTRLFEAIKCRKTKPLKLMAAGFNLQTLSTRTKVSLESLIGDFTNISGSKMDC